MSTRTKTLLAVIVGNSIFGFSFLFSKVALNVVSPSVLLSIRFLTAFLAMTLVLVVGKIKITLKGKPVFLLVLQGLLNPVIYFITESYGISMTTASFSGIIIGTSPVICLFLGVIILKERCTVFQAVCAVLSVIGVALTTTGGTGSNSMLGFLMLLIAMLSGSMFSIISRKISAQFTAFERTYVMFFLASVVFTSMALVENHGNWVEVAISLGQPTLWVSVVYLAVGASVCAFLCLNYALTYYPAGKAMIFTNLQCVISILAGILILGDQFTLLQLLGAGIIILSVFGVSVSGKEKEELTNCNG